MWNLIPWKKNGGDGGALAAEPFEREFSRIRNDFDSLMQRMWSGFPGFGDELSVLNAVVGIGVGVHDEGRRLDADGVALADRIVDQDGPGGLRDRREARIDRGDRVRAEVVAE